MERDEHVPSGFSKGIIVPLVKDKSGDVCSSSNYRPITLVRIISNVFEMFILNFCADNLVSDDHHFGFKNGLGCANAIFTLKTTTDYFTGRGSSIYAASLDISKAFDTVNHYKLMCSLMKVVFPKCLVAMLIVWYSNLEIVVRWNMYLSNTLSARSGVRQGRILSPSLFNIFINLIIVNLKTSNTGCVINRTYPGCCMYSDDLIILSTFLSGLKAMLTNFLHTCSQLSLSLNAGKSCCVYFGPRCCAVLDDLVLGNAKITWNSSLVFIFKWKNIGVNIEIIRHNFFMYCNNILSHSSGLCDLVQLQLHDSYVLPTDTYATAGIN